MADRRRPFALLLAAAMSAAACTGASPETATTTPAASTVPSTAAPTAAPASPQGAPSSGSPSTPAPPSAPGGPVLDQAWATATLTDVTTGQPFRIADFGGKVVFIETMAIWCVNCRVQQADAQSALAKLDRSKVVYIALDVEPSEKPADLAAYREQNGWDFVYAVSPPEVSRALATEFGDLVLNPPATPIVVVGTDGTVTLTDFGHKDPDALIALARAHGA